MKVITFAALSSVFLRRLWVSRVRALNNRTSEFCELNRNVIHGLGDFVTIRQPSMVTRVTESDYIPISILCFIFGIHCFQDRSERARKQVPFRYRMEASAKTKECVA